MNHLFYRNPFLSSEDTVPIINFAITSKPQRILKIHKWSKISFPSLCHYCSFVLSLHPSLPASFSLSLPPFFPPATLNKHAFLVCPKGYHCWLYGLVFPLDLSQKANKQWVGFSIGGIISWPVKRKQGFWLLWLQCRAGGDFHGLVEFFI